MFLFYLKHPLRFLREIKYYVKRSWQRAKRGWADSDTWNMDMYLLEILPQMLHHLAEHAHGHPCDMTPEVWGAYLHNTAYLLENAREEVRDQKNEYTDETEYFERDRALFEEQKIMVAEAFKMLAERFYDLWD